MPDPSHSTLPRHRHSRRLPLRRFSACTLVLLLAFASTALAQSDAPVDTSATYEPLILRFHHFALRLPQTPGWELVRKEPEKQTITIRNASLGEGNDTAFVHAEVRVSRQWYPSEVERTPEHAFNYLAMREVSAARRSVPEGEMRWLGADRDTLRDDRREYRRLWYGMSNERIRADAWVVFWFPPDFQLNGYFYTFSLVYQSRPDLKDESVVHEFGEIVRSTEFFEPVRDPRIVPAGADSLGRAGSSLPFVYYDLRMQAVNTPIDTTIAPCWIQVQDSLAVEIAPTLHHSVTFFSFRDRVPAADSREHGSRVGKAFDRNEDGRMDLLFFRQGNVLDRTQRTFQAFYVIADEDFDGDADAIVFEDGDQDRDGRVDHYLYGQDRSGDGTPDRLWQFDDDIAAPIKPVTKQETRFFIGRAARPGVESFDLADELAQWSRSLAAIHQAVAHCRK